MTRGICTRAAPAERERRKMGAVIFCDTKYTKIQCALMRQKWAREDKSCAQNNAHFRCHQQCFQVLKMQQNRWRLKFRPRPYRESWQRSTKPPTGFKGPTLRPVLLRGVEGRRGGGEGAKMIYAPGARNLRAATARPRQGRGLSNIGLLGPQFEVTPLAHCL